LPLSEVGIAVAESVVAESMVANSDGEGVSCDLLADLSGSLLHTLHYGDMGHGSGSGETESERGSAVGEAKSSIGVASAVKKGGVRVSIGRPLADVVTIAVAESVVAESMVANSDGGGHGGEDRGVVDEGSGGSEDLGGASQDSGVSLPLADVVAIAVAESVVAESVVAHSDGEGVSGNLLADLSGSLLYALHYGDMGHGSSSSETKRGSAVGEAESSVGVASAVEKGGVSLWGT